MMLLYIAPEGGQNVAVKFKITFVADDKKVIAVQFTMLVSVFTVSRLIQNS